MTLDPTNFLHSLATWIAAATSPALAYAATPRQLWRQGVKEADAADPYTVLKIYGGPPMPWHQMTRMNVQSQSVASETAGQEAGMKQAWSVFNTLLGSDGHPLRMVTINGFLASGAGTTADGTYLLVYVNPLQRPGMTGRDDRGRSLWTFNFEIGVNKTS